MVRQGRVSVRGDSRARARAEPGPSRRQRRRRARAAQRPPPRRRLSATGYRPRRARASWTPPRRPPTRPARPRSEARHARVPADRAGEWAHQVRAQCRGDSSVAGSPGCGCLHAVMLPRLSAVGAGRLDGRSAPLPVGPSPATSPRSRAEGRPEQGGVQQGGIGRAPGSGHSAWSSGADPLGPARRTRALAGGRGLSEPTSVVAQHEVEEGCGVHGGGLGRTVRMGLAGPGRSPR